MRKPTRVLATMFAVSPIIVAAPRAMIGVVDLMIDRRSSPVSAAKSDVKATQAFLDFFQVEQGRYPTTREGLDALTYAPRPVRDDPWGNPYRYRREGEGYVLESLGADGKPGGEDDAADIVERR